ncbi:MAG: hypothetical protein JST54_29130 [Deltaproteobacteria bacterium]|nr:hypothetical protein [Deltaproteobacteria bacterium]
MDERELDDRPRILGVRFGANPNSSSLGVDVTFLLFGGAAALGASLFLSAWLRARKKPAQVVGQEPAKDAP